MPQRGPQKGPHRERDTPTRSPILSITRSRVEEPSELRKHSMFAPQPTQDPVLGSFPLFFTRCVHAAGWHHRQGHPWHRDHPRPCSHGRSPAGGPAQAEGPGAPCQQLL